MTTNKKRLNFARVCIEVSADANLVEAFDLRMDLEDKTETVEIKVEYQWKPSVCHSCKVFGHKEGYCSQKGAFQSSQTKPDMNINSSRDKGKAITIPRRDVGGSIGVPQSGKIIPQVGDTVASSSSADRSVTNQCSIGSQDDTQVTTNIITTIIVSDKNHAEQAAKPIQSSNKFESLNMEGGEIVVDLSPAPSTNSGDVAIFKRQVMEVESIGHKLEVENMPEGEHKKKKTKRKDSKQGKEKVLEHLKTKKPLLLC